jgi:hypothetical protein
MRKPVFVLMKLKAGARAITAGASIREPRARYQRLMVGCDQGVDQNLPEMTA